MTFFTTYIFRPLIKSGRFLHKWSSGAILIVFFISGLWHGASWNFVLFGLVNGIVIIIERKTKFARKIRQRQRKKNLSFVFNVLLIFYTLTILSFSSIWFKTGTFSEGIDILKHIGNFSFGNTHIRTVTYVIMLMLIGMAADYFRKNYLSTPFETIKHHYGRLTIYVMLIVMIVLYGNNNEVTFIYYQF
jgi:D-alanyl-lipoteichoic acid acyltransferase DltB (MBOAT superfamily)